LKTKALLEQLYKGLELVTCQRKVNVLHDGKSYLSLFVRFSYIPRFAVVHKMQTMQPATLGRILQTVERFMQSALPSATASRSRDRPIAQAHCRQIFYCPLPCG
jgi:hypothetical protein